MTTLNYLQSRRLNGIPVKHCSDFQQFYLHEYWCATASVARGKQIESSNVDLPNDVTIQILNILDSYKYLGVFENNVVKDSEVKSLVITNYKKRVRKILKSAWNGRNIIIAINTWAISLIRYTGGIIKWWNNKVDTG